LSLAPAAAGGTRLVVEGVSHRFQTEDGSTPALSHVSLTVEPGEFVTIVGRSGCGKSTLLNIMAGLLKPSEGTVQVEAAQNRSRLPMVGYITQHDSLLPWRTARENAAFPLELHGIGRAERLARADELLGRVGLADFVDRLPHQLSGGMKQRLAIARTLIYEPRVLLMDEPFGALDAQTRALLHDLLLDLWHEARTTIVFVTHDILEAIALGDRVVTLSAHPGRVHGIYDVTLPRPRTMSRLQGDSAAAELHRLVSADLRAMGG
jgi:NitT/TauT family transport system ATP-binding protein